MIGRRLSHYLVLECIGTGGMGEVYRARDERLHRDVALKVLPGGLPADDDARRRFRREALALSRLNHPHIATVHDFDSDAGVDFLVMELVPGKSLDALLEAGPLAEAEIRRLGTQLAEGLGAAHGQGVIHRDLKPANLRVTPDGRLKILDFGLSRLTQRAAGVTLSTTETTHEISGTLHYLAPEVLNGEAADARSDLFAVGIVLYEMATGQRPFGGDGPAQVLYAIANQDPRPPRSLSPRVTPALEAVILKSLEKDPRHRYASADALRVDLGRMDVRPRRSLPWRSAAAAALGLVLVLAYAWDLGGVRRLLRFGSGVPGIQALAVLPIENTSGDSEEQYFADGMTDELISELARIEAIRIIARSSVMSLRGTTERPREIARRLRVDAIVFGRVRRQADRVRLSAELVRGSSEQTIWAESFEGSLSDVLTLQRRLTLAIVGKIRSPLSRRERSRLATGDAVDPEAYKAYLKGRYFWAKYSEEGFRKAQEFFNQAIEIDPGYAVAYAGLADAWYGPSNLYLAPNVAIPRARAAALKALSLDSTLAEAHMSLGIVKAAYDWDWVGSERELKRAIELKPNDAMAHYWYSYFLVTRERFDEGLAEARRALELDPLSVFLTASLGGFQCLARRYTEAAEMLRSALAMDPEFSFAHGMLGLTLEQQGDYAGAIAALEKAVSLDRNSDVLAQLGHAYAVSGRPERAREVLAELLRRSENGFVPAFDVARVHAGLGDKDQAFLWLNRACEDHSELLMWLAVDPEIDNLRSDPRMAALRQRIGMDSASPAGGGATDR